MLMNIDWFQLFSRIYLEYLEFVSLYNVDEYWMISAVHSDLAHESNAQILQILQIHSLFWETDGWAIFIIIIGRTQDPWIQLN